MQAGFNVLHLAAMGGDYDTVVFLLDIPGLDADAENPYVSDRSSIGPNISDNRALPLHPFSLQHLDLKTPLDCAIAWNRTEICDLLLWHSESARAVSCGSQVRVSCNVVVFCTRRSQLQGHGFCCAD